VAWFGEQVTRHLTDHGLKLLAFGLGEPRVRVDPIEQAHEVVTGSLVRLERRAVRGELAMKRGLCIIPGAQALLALIDLLHQAGEALPDLAARA